MLENVKLTPISGTFINMIIPDTGITNAGIVEWEQDFQMLKYLGFDKIFVIRTEFEQNGRHLSAEDPAQRRGKRTSAFWIWFSVWRTSMI